MVSFFSGEIVCEPASVCWMWCIHTFEIRIRVFKRAVIYDSPVVGTKKRRGKYRKLKINKLLFTRSYWKEGKRRGSESWMPRERTKSRIYFLAFAIDKCVESEERYGWGPLERERVPSDPEYVGFQPSDFCNQRSRNLLEPLERMEWRIWKIFKLQFLPITCGSNKCWRKKHCNQKPILPKG